VVIVKKLRGHTNARREHRSVRAQSSPRLKNDVSQTNRHYVISGLGPSMTETKVHKVLINDESLLTIRCESDAVL
jgi:hypothetical protein